MLDVAISHIVNQVNQHLMRIDERDEKVVVVSNILEQDGTVAAHVNDKIVVSLVNIEKDTVPFQTQKLSSNGLRSLATNPPIYFNLYLMFASYFSGSNYPEGLKYIAKTINYFQAQNVFDRQNSPGMDSGIEKLILDIENLDLNDLSNLWGILSGKYLPSVLYKVRMVTVDANAVKDQISGVTKPQSSMANSS